MQSDNRFLDDAARVASGALGALAGVRREIEQLARHQLERVLATMNLVTREEFETVRLMAAKARAEQEELVARVAALEAALASRGEPAPALPDDRR
jgi:hypothetical protein